MIAYYQSMTANTPREAHACNCVGCCQRCGTCKTSPRHTAAYCDLLAGQRRDRDELAITPNSVFKI